MSAVLSLFLQVLPLALGAAMSPTFLAMQVVVLTSPAPGALRRGWALAAGSMSMLLLISFGGVSLLNSIPVLHTDGPTWTQAVILVVAGVALLLVARQVHRRPKERRDSILDKLVDAEPPFIFAAGAVRLALNASTLALYLPALHIITSADVDLVVKGLAFLMLFLITETAVLGPVLAVTIAGDKAKPVLTRIHDRMEQLSKPLTVGTAAGFGVVLIGMALWTVIQVL